VVREPPVLVPIEPTVWVVQDSDVAVYYVGGFYWHWRAGVWYRSTYWDGDWVVIGVHVVPPLIVHRHHAHYVRYHAPPNVHVWRAPPEHSRHHRRPPDRYQDNRYRPAGHTVPPRPSKPRPHTVPPRVPHKPYRVPDQHRRAPKLPRKPYRVPERVEPPRKRPYIPPDRRRLPKKVPRRYQPR
jgi:hypothetical protein